MQKGVKKEWKEDRVVKKEGNFCLINHTDVLKKTLDIPTNGLAKYTNPNLMPCTEIFTFHNCTTYKYVKEFPDIGCMGNHS